MALLFFEGLILMTYKAGIVGGAGFAGIELARILLQHPGFDLCAVTSDALAETPLAKAYPAFSGHTDLVFQSNGEADMSSLDVAFLAVPHTAALKHAPELLASGVTVVDLSADFRLKDAAVYESYYDAAHTQPELLASAAFGLPELFPQALEDAADAVRQGSPALVACAGCYPTATSIAAAPAVRAGLVRDDATVVVDAISGVTGAGKKATERTHFCFANDNLEAYGVTTHRHTPEIEQILGLSGRIVFTPHLAPLNRGLLSTVTIPLGEGCGLGSTADFVELYEGFYEECAFVDVMPEGVFPKTSSVVGTNHAHVGVAFDPRTNSLVAVGAIDNLCKGAAGQAVQCANVVFGLPEAAGLASVGLPV